MKKLHALVLGGTGATGQELVKLLLKDSNFSKVSIFVRRTLNIEHKKLTTHKIDFSRLNEYKELVAGDILFSALGTTKKDETIDASIPIVPTASGKKSNDGNTSSLLKTIAAYANGATNDPT